MLEGLFTWLSGLVESTFLLALVGAFLWGVLSILLSPCHLASIPLVVGYISQQGESSFSKAFRTSLAFSVGILVTIGLVGLVTALLGRMMGDIGKWGNYLVAGIFFLVGLYLLGIIRVDIPGAGQVKFKKKGIWAALVLGLIFGIALGPCTFAFMAPILAITLFSTSSSLLKDISLLGMYGVGHCLVIVLAGTFTEVIQKYLNWNERSKGTRIVKGICGILVIIAGIYMLTI
ncbi:MAG: cytochrome c biogenesis protein CcdA [Acidobacteria bacterium]|jgi:cytochrome c-type biogenesis protein|nr:cytochrome c biogenesis protein CcdA [Acidobacteriota bacterium]